MEGTAELFTGFAERIAREKGTRQEMMREGDYIEDGLIHCGKCKGKRQTRVKIPCGDGTTITVPCICKCEAKAEEDRKKQEEARQELQRMERLRSAKNTLQHEKEVAAVYMEAAKGRKFEKGRPLDIRIIAYYPIPKSASKKKQREMLEHRLRPTVKPDLDNVAKLVYDALNGVAWYDDNAIVDTQVRKFYSDTPRVEVFIRAVE